MKKERGIWVPITILELSDLNPFQMLLLSKITTLSDNKRDGCFATNKYFAELFRVSTKHISRSISVLKKSGYIIIQLDKKEGNRRRIHSKLLNRSNLHSEKYIANEQEGKLNQSLSSTPRHQNVYHNKEENKEIKKKENSHMTHSDFLNVENSYEVKNLFIMFPLNLNEERRFKEYFNSKCNQMGIPYNKAPLKMFKRILEKWYNNIHNIYHDGPSIADIPTFRGYRKYD